MPASQLAVLRGGPDRWNEWRRRHPDVEPDFRDADLTRISLAGANLFRAHLNRAKLQGSDLTRA